MKKVITLVCLALIVAGTASAQKQNGNWREKVRSEKIAFITMELDLSEAEAQVFWPVYNDVEKTRREAFQESRAAAKALKEALAKGEGDVNALLDEYLAKREKARGVDVASLARYKKVLPIEKVAKLVLAEEKFRHNQIGKVQDDNGKGFGGHGKGHGNRPGGQNRQPSRNLQKAE